MNFSPLNEILFPIADKAASVYGVIQENEIRKNEIAFQRAREERERAEAAAEASRNLMSNNTVRNVLFWSLTTIAGGVLTTIVLKQAGIK